MKKIGAVVTRTVEDIRFQQTHNPIGLFVFKLDNLLKRRHGKINQNESNELNTRAIRALLGKSSHRTNRQTEDAAGVEPAEFARIEAEAPRLGGIARIRRRGPVAAARAGVEKARLVAEAGGRKENAPVRIRTLACDEPPIDAILSHPSGGTIAGEG